MRVKWDWCPGVAGPSPPQKHLPLSLKKAETGRLRGGGRPRQGQVAPSLSMPQFPDKMGLKSPNIRPGRRIMYVKGRLRPCRRSADER